MASCSRCRRWRPCARRSTPSSTAIWFGTRPIFPTKASASEVHTTFELFDRSILYSDDSRFVLSGIINRMDRAYVSPDSCGEIRLIYRLTRTGMPEPGEGAASPRLPMTLNVVLKAKADHAVDGNGAALGCAEIARRWLKAGESAAVGAELAKQLIANDGPLDLIRPENIDRIETNLQIAHAPKTPRHDFRTDYLLKVFRYDAQAQRFDEAPLENQIDRERILADPELKREFRAWLLDPGNFSELDRGTILIPEKFLASRAIAATPVGFDPSKLQPAFGLVQGDDAAAKPVFSDHDVVAALKQAAERGVGLQNIRSVAGFERRLNDITCAGCHQTRGIGGFHFPGVDWMAAKPSNSTIVPGSPHFFGDQVRRRDILMALRDGRRPDYSRGFSSRPQLRGSTELAGTEYEDGWGAHCYRQMPDARDDDLQLQVVDLRQGTGVSDRRREVADGDVLYQYKGAKRPAAAAPSRLTVSSPIVFHRERDRRSSGCRKGTWTTSSSLAAASAA